MPYIIQKQIFYKSINTVKTSIFMDTLLLSNSNIQYGTNQYVQYIPGGRNSKVIISATHGGNVKPKCMPHRMNNFQQNNFNDIDCVLTKSDVYTKEMALLLREELSKLSSSVEDKRPHLVICNLHRSRVDMNRSIVEACLNVPEAMTAYNEFHEFLSQAKVAVENGLLLDIHGHTHTEELVELGYLVSNQELRKGNYHPDKSSIRSLAQKSTFPFEDLIAGPVSLGKFLQDKSIDTIPSPKFHQLKSNCFTGGYTISHHGSQANGGVDAIQIEIHKKYRNEDQSPKFISNLAKSIKEFMDIHYGGI